MNSIRERLKNSKEKDDSETKEKMTLSKLGIDPKSLIIGLLAALLIAAICFILFRNNNPYRYIETSSMEESLKESYVETDLSNKEFLEAKQNLLETVKNVRDNNGYIHVYTDTDVYDTYIYNKKGEVFIVQNDETNMVVSRNDGKSVRFTDTIAVSENLDILQLVINSLNALDNKSIKLYENKSTAIDTTEYVGYHEYIARFDSYDKIRQLYTSVSDEFADDIMLTIQESFDENTIPVFEMQYMISDNGALTIACYIVDNEEHYINWYFDGYLTIYDWELPEEWYTYDFSDAEKSEELLQNLAEYMQSILAQYAEDNEMTLTNGNEESTEEGSEENSEETYEYGGELDLSEMPTISAEEAAEILKNSEEEDSGIDKLEELNEK